MIDDRAAQYQAELAAMVCSALCAIGQRYRRGIEAVRGAADRDHCPRQIADGITVWECKRNGTCGCGR